MKDQREPTPAERAEVMFARRLRELRAERGLSQAALAEKVTSLGTKMDDLAILRIEKNAEDVDRARRIRLGEAVIISKALSVRLEEMLRATHKSDNHLQAAEADLAAALAERDRALRARDEMTARATQIEHLVHTLTERVSHLRRVVESEKSDEPE
ncbi:hypothetical protein ABZU76_02895 [Amycolatopsis sp. NPDC005232]|uniref:hypothetical protein n=1 Tax=Amycolatopsis sp. NPDC005232 TaxID=3157027 RepID=UPI0033B1DD59